MPKRTSTLENNLFETEKSPEPSNAQILQFLKDTFKTNLGNGVSKQAAVQDLVGTLPDWAIKEYIKAGIIKIDPLPEDWEELVDEVTIDFHLGNMLRVFANEGLNTIDIKHTTKEEMEAMMKVVELKPGQPFILTENDFVIATTRERLTIPDNIVGHLHGKSSLARLGIAVHSTAARFDPGWDGHPVLEFGTFLKGKRVIIYEGSPICAFSFEKLSASVERSYKDSPNNRYGGSNLPKVSNIMGTNQAVMHNLKRRKT